jgi:dTDP-4-amino-4,6-dideoxygalactose transaminase
VLGLRQLERLPDWVRQRERNANIWIRTLADLPMLHTPRLDPAHRHAWYRCYFYIKPEMLSSGWSRDELIAAVNAAGVPCFSGSCSEIYLEHAFADAGVAPPERLPVARQMGETSIAFLVDPSWTIEETTAAASTTRSILVAASRQLEAA